MHKFFTAGYGGHRARSLLLAARALDAFVLDIRHVPQSQNPGYSKKDLLESLDTRYFHVPQLGNVNVKTGGEIKLKDAAAGINWAVRLAQCHPVILLCGCGDYHTCHRKTVAGLLAERGIQSSELEWPQVPKLDLTDLPDTALSVKQPWAWLLAAGIKDIENRTWSTPFRGPFLIHASKTVDIESWSMLCEDPHLFKILPNLNEMDRGGIVGVGNVVDCVQRSSSRWFCGPKGFIIEEAEPLTFMELRGAQGFFSLQAQLEAMRKPKALVTSKQSNQIAASEAYGSMPVVQASGQGTLF